MVASRLRAGAPERRSPARPRRFRESRSRSRPTSGGRWSCSASSAPEVVGDLLAEAGIELLTESTPLSVRSSAARPAGRRARSRADDVVALPALEVPRIDGIPQRSAGLHPDRHPAQRRGADRRLGGGRRDLVSDQAGRARRPAGRCRRRVDRLAGGRARPRSRPSGRCCARRCSPAPCRATFARRCSPASTTRSSPAALWSPPTKLAGRYLSSYLSAAAHSGSGDGTFADLEPPAARSWPRARAPALRARLRARGGGCRCPQGRLRRRPRLAPPGRGAGARPAAGLPRAAESRGGATAPPGIRPDGSSVVAVASIREIGRRIGERRRGTTRARRGDARPGLLPACAPIGRASRYPHLLGLPRR